MRYIARALVLVVTLALLAPNLISAQDYISDATQALEHGNVYVAPGTEGIDVNTAIKLQSRLTGNDNIVLVMLPSTAEKDTGLDITTITTRLSEKLGNKRIIGLSVGRKVVGYGPTLSPGVAADQMQRADNVSNDSVTALSTFAQNIHRVQAESPRPTATPTPKPTPVPQTTTQSKDEMPWIPIGLISFGITCYGVAWIIKRRMVLAEVNKTHFRAPDQVKDLLSKIAKERSLIDDPGLQQTLYQMCLDIERYFLKTSQDKEKDSFFFKDQLSKVSDVLNKYVEIQNSPDRYYENRSALLLTGKESVNDFSQYVVESIRRGQNVDLVDYSVKTKILQAQKYR